MLSKAAWLLWSAVAAALPSVAAVGPAFGASQQQWQPRDSLVLAMLKSGIYVLHLTRQLIAAAATAAAASVLPGTAAAEGMCSPPIGTPTQEHHQNTQNSFGTVPLDSRCQALQYETVGSAAVKARAQLPRPQCQGSLTTCVNTHTHTHPITHRMSQHMCPRTRIHTHPDVGLWVHTNTYTHPHTHVPLPHTRLRRVVPMLGTPFMMTRAQSMRCTWCPLASSTSECPSPGFWWRVLGVWG